jgi:hypothetical protein
VVFARLPSLQRHGHSQCGSGQGTKHYNWRIIPVEWVQIEQYTNDIALCILGRAKNTSEPITPFPGTSALGAKRDFHGTTSTLLCVLIVRIERGFHVVLFMILVDKPGILQKKLQLQSKYPLFSAMTDVGKLVQG